MGHIPYGYQLAPDGIHLIINDEEQLILGKIKALRIKGCSIRDIAYTMNRNQRLNRDNAPWNHASIFRILKFSKILNKGFNLK